MNEDWRYESGKAIGTMIMGMFKLVAAIDGITVRDAVDQWVSSWIANRIIEGDEE